MKPPTAHLLAALVALLLGGPAAAREDFTGVTAVVADSVSGSMERRIDDAEQVRVIVGEVNALRRKSWTSYEGRLGRCAVRLSFYASRERVGVLVVQGDELLEPGVSRGSGRKRTLGTFDAPSTRRLAARIHRPGDCKA
jgi:hypothetical protein